MKRIRKIETSVGLTGNVVNNKSTSTSNAYSCDYINNDLKALILDMAHPIGSYYWSSDSTNPHDLFGGTWVQIKDKFIIAVGDSHTVGQSYGSNTKDISHTHSFAHTHGVPGVAHTHTTGNHTLTVAEIPSHTHWTREIAPGLYAGWGNKSQDGWITQSLNASNGGTWETAATGGSRAHNHGNTGSTTPSATTTNSQSTSTSGSGGSTTLDITPACEAAYCWKRTA